MTLLRYSGFLPKNPTGIPGIERRVKGRGAATVGALTALPVLVLLVTCLFTLVCLPSAGSASSPPADSIHFCAFDGFERWRRDRPRPAAKRPAALNVGEPRTVRMIYFLPNDWPYRSDVVDSMKTLIRQAQTFFGEQMRAHGYGNRTFRIETDAQGGPLVHRVDARHSFIRYDNTLGHAVTDELGQTFDLNANIYFIVLGTDAVRQGNGAPVGGVARSMGKAGGTAMFPSQFSLSTVVHELGHTFALPHDFRNPEYVMSYGGPRTARFSGCSAEILSVHPYLNPAIPIESGPPPTIELISPTEYPPGSERVSIQLRVKDPDGLHQVSIGVHGTEACRGLVGVQEAVVEFEYNGRYGQDHTFTGLGGDITNRIGVIAFDATGDASSELFVLVEDSPYRLATLEAHRGRVLSVAFSPGGSILASGSEDGTVRLWDVESRKQIATLEGSYTVVFSPDGSALASGSRDGTVKLWDMEKREQIATLEGHTGRVVSVTFSPDGSTLASGSEDGTVRLWDVESRRQIATLEGHSRRVWSVAFTPDGSTLASGARDGTVKLWDVERRMQTGSLEMHTTTVLSVAFSHDGATLACGAISGMLKLWDVATQKLIATLEGHTANVFSVAFSPDGATLASGEGYGEVRLWDVVTGDNLHTFLNAGAISAVAFSPDGTTLASASWDGRVNLWDVSEWARRRPVAIEIISGDRRQGTPGAELDEPLVVEVRDQYGDPVPGAVVTFTVMAGDGRLNGRNKLQHTTAGADGRAEVTLTLGPDQGPNIVGVSLGGRELGAFTALGVGAAAADLQGDYRTWHLPRTAAVRLGKGVLGEGDRAVALSADGRTLAVASAIGVWLYDAATARALALLPTASPAHSMAFSVAGTLASGLYNGQVQLWEAKSGERIGTLRHADRGRVTAVVFSPDGTRLASGSWDQSIKLWDVASRREVGAWVVPREGYSRWFLSVAFSPDGVWLASGFEDGTVRLWDVGRRTELATLRGHTGEVRSVTFSPDGAVLASAGGFRDGTVRLWDVGGRTELATLRGHTGEVRSVTFSPDGAVLASAGGADGTVRLWDVERRTELATLRGHTAGVRTVAFSNDGATLVSGGADGAVLLQDVKTGNIAGIAGHGSLHSMALSPDGALLASAEQSNDGAVRLWDAATNTEVATLRSHTAGVTAVSFSSNGALLALGSWDHTVELWEVANRELAGTLEGHADGVTAVSFSSNGALLASGSWDHTVKLWDVATKTEVATLRGHTEGVRSVSFSSDNAILASGSVDRTVKLWDVERRELIGTLEGHSQGVNAVAFAPDGKTVVSASEDSGIRLWDVNKRTNTSILYDREKVYSIAFSPNGRTLASGSWKSVKLWDIGMNGVSATLKGHTAIIHSVAFSRDGATLASGASDGTMLMWDLTASIPPPPETPSPDFDGDGTIDIADFLLFTQQFALREGDPGYDARFDLDGNGAVGLSDFLIFAGAFGQSG